jgi:hypothetical protein
VLAIILLSGLLWSASDDPNAQSRALTTNELEALLRGTSIIEPHRPNSCCWYPEMFAGRGEYVRYADNYEAHGTYRFQDGQICVLAEREEELCRHVMVDAEGHYWISRPHSPQSFKRIEISKLKD